MRGPNFMGIKERRPNEIRDRFVFWQHVHLEYPKNRKTNRKYLHNVQKMVQKIEEFLNGKFRKKVPTLYRSL